MSFPTPKYQLPNEGDVYPPAEDTFLLLDALEADLEFLRTLCPKIAVEVGSGSGVVTVFLQQLLASYGIHFRSLATDLNASATQCTKKTAEINGVGSRIEAVQCDLVSGLAQRLQGSVDLLVFNPPYVPTEMPAKGREELCFAGGKSGRIVLDRLMLEVPTLLSKRGALYVIALKENNVPEMLTIYAGLKGTILLERWCGIEYLYVIKFQLSS